MDEKAWIRWTLLAARGERDLDGLALDTGIDAVDADHRVLLRYAVELNLLLDSMAEGGVSEKALADQDRLIRDFASYAAYHFAREEEFVLRMGAPGIERQRREHGRIVGTLSGLTAEFAAGRTSVPAELRGSVFAWVVDHIAQSDLESFRAEGLVPALSKAREWADLREILRSTGIDALDLEHRRIAEAILAASTTLTDLAATPEGRPQGSEAGGAAEAEKGRGERVLGELRRVASEHFTHEEALLAAHDEGNLEEQRAAHRDFLATVDEALAACADGACGPGEEAGRLAELSHGFLRWLMTHIGKLDYDSFRRSGWMRASYTSAREASALFPLIRRTGIPAIDTDHRGFIERSFAVFESLGHGEDGILPRDAVPAIQGLAGFAADHFRREEAIIAAAPERYELRLVERHREEHHALERSFAGLLADAGAGRLGLAGALRDKLSIWWIGHTNGTDIETFGSAVDAQGATR